MSVRYLSMAEMSIPIQSNRERVELNARRSNYYTAEARTSVFLSHKHDEDPDLIENVKALFLKLGAGLYIDWQDETMPQVTNAQTAQRLKDAISGLRKFVMLATPASINSIWIPWEIGLADQLKGLANMAMLPILNSNETWKKREYCLLYDRIVEVDGTWCIMEPGYEYTPKMTLLDWLKR